MNEAYKNKKILHRLFHKEELTQKEIAERLDCAHGTVSNWMRKYDIETRKKNEYKCQQCQKTVKKYPSQVTGKNFFCSTKCHGEWQSENRVGESHPLWEGGEEELECDHCGESFQKYKSKIRWNHQFCTTKCFYKWRNEIKSPLYYGKNWQKISDKAREVVDTCQRKGCWKKECDNGAKLHVHHLTPVREFDEPEKAHFEENLVVLCAKHHQRIESKENQKKLLKK
jgi:transcriptional regulator with XRE-family HTH domain